MTINCSLTWFLLETEVVLRDKPCSYSIVVSCLFAEVRVRERQKDSEAESRGKKERQTERYGEKREIQREGRERE